MSALILAVLGIGGLILFSRARGRDTAELPPAFTSEEFSVFPIPEGEPSSIEGPGRIPTVEELDPDQSGLQFVIEARQASEALERESQQEDDPGFFADDPAQQL